MHWKAWYSNHVISYRHFLFCWSPLLLGSTLAKLISHCRIGLCSWSSLSVLQRKLSAHRRTYSCRYYKSAIRPLLSKNPPLTSPHFQGKKINKLLLSFPNYFFLITNDDCELASNPKFGCLTSNFLYLSVSTFYREVISTGGDNSNKVCFGINTKFFRESGDFAGIGRPETIFRKY